MVACCLARRKSRWKSNSKVDSEGQEKGHENRNVSELERSINSWRRKRKRDSYWSARNRDQKLTLAVALFVSEALYTTLVDDLDSSIWLTDTRRRLSSLKVFSLA